MEKMSKSRGNVVTIDEVQFAVYDIDSRYEFRDASNRPVNYTALGVWRDRCGDGQFYAATRLGRVPIWLCLIGQEEPPLLEGKEQHPGSGERFYLPIGHY